MPGAALGRVQPGQVDGGLQRQAVHLQALGAGQGLLQPGQGLFGRAAGLQQQHALQSQQLGLVVALAMTIDQRQRLVDAVLRRRGLAGQGQRLGLQRQVEGQGHHRAGGGPHRMALGHRRQAGLGLAQPGHQPALHHLGMRQPDHKAAALADLHRPRGGHQALGQLTAEVVRDRQKTLRLADAEGVVQALGQLHHLLRAPQRFIGPAQLPQGPGRIAQAHHARVLHRHRAVAEGRVVGQALVHQRQRLQGLALVEEQIGLGPARLDAGQRVGVGRQAGGHLGGDGTGPGKVGAHEVVALQPQPHLVEGHAVAHPLAQQQGPAVDRLHRAGAIAGGGDQPAGQQQLQAQLLAVAFGPVGQAGQLGQGQAQVGNRLGVGRALGRLARGLLPAGQGLGGHAGQGMVPGQQLGPAAAQAAELLLQHGGDAGVQAAPVTLKHRLVGRVAHQRMLEDVAALAAAAAGLAGQRQQAGLHQRVERARQRGQADRRLGMAVDGLDLGPAEAAPQRAAQLGGALGQRQLVEPGHQQVLQRGGHGAAQRGGDVGRRLLRGQGRGHARRLLDEQRHAVGALGQPAGQVGVQHGQADGALQQGPGGLISQAAQHQLGQLEGRPAGGLGSAVAQRQQQQQVLLGRAVDQALHQRAGGRVDPVHVFDQQAHRRLLVQALRDVHQQVHGALAQALGGDGPGQRRQALGRQRQQAAQQRDRGIGLGAAGHLQLAQRAELGLEGVAFVDPQPAAQQLDHRLEGAAGMLGRAAAFQRAVAGGGQAAAELAHQARLADAGVAAQQQ